jgi:hypothetical protein
MAKNVALFKKMVEFYNTNAYTHEYMFGFRFNGNIWLVNVTSEFLPYALTLDKASRGAGYALRFKPNRGVKTELLAQGATVICSEKLFDKLCAESQYNKGEIFEKLVTEMFGQTWEKDNVPFTEDGDLTVDGIAYQIKFEKATFINEKQMLRMGA